MLADMLQAECVSIAMDARTKEMALRQLANLFAKGDVDADEETIFRVFSEREALASTGVGSGVAIPHGRLSNVPGVRLVLGLHPTGVDFDAVDGRPVHIFVGVLAPNGEASKHLKVLARVSRLLREASVRRRLLDAATREAARHVIVGDDDGLV
jgi:PTS system nitrogen regulatory IIA component